MCFGGIFNYMRGERYVRMYVNAMVYLLLSVRSCASGPGFSRVVHGVARR